MAIDAVERIVSDLSSMDMTKQDYFEANGNAYVEKLNELHQWVVSQVGRLSRDSRILVTNHESLGYFADRYNFEIIGTIIEGLSSDGNVTPRGLIDILDTVADNEVNVIFGELHMADKIAQTISEDTGVLVERLYSENFDSSGSGVTNYIEMIETNVQTVVGGLESSYTGGRH
jgi:ABC-type Zn uptake system ZnuABC Zn-binding protein ZnuA